MDEKIKKGDCVTPLRSMKHDESVWPRSFGKGKSYPVQKFDKLDGEKVLVLQTGATKDETAVVYPDEVKKAAAGKCSRK